MILDCDAGFTIKYCFDGKTVSLKRLQAKLKVLQTDVLDNLLLDQLVSISVEVQ